jgi:hypothetical protein
VPQDFCLFDCTFGQARLIVVVQSYLPFSGVKDNFVLLQERLLEMLFVVLKMAVVRAKVVSPFLSMIGHNFQPGRFRAQDLAPVRL